MKLIKFKQKEKKILVAGIEPTSSGSKSDILPIRRH